MLAQINQVIAEGYRPAIFIDDWLASVESLKAEFRQLKAEAKRLDVLVVHSGEFARLHAFPKLHVFRYGEIPGATQAIILRRKGRIVAGALVPTLNLVES